MSRRRHPILADALEFVGVVAAFGGVTAIALGVTALLAAFGAPPQ